MILEYQLPGREQPFMMAVEQGEAIMRFAGKERRVGSVAISEGFDTAEPYDLIDVIRKLRKVSRKKEIIPCVSGRRMSHDKLATLLTEIAELNISAVSTHSGVRLPDHPTDEKGQPFSCAEDYMDTCRMIHRIRRSWPDVFLGARINPFKYTLPDAHLQYYKMMKSLATGADFVVAQAGWDMKKIHELQWYQRHRKIEEPVIARLMLLQTDDVTRIINQHYPGLVISKELGTRVQREYVDPVDGLNNAIRRLALQAAGCRLLGCSGIQIAGVCDLLTTEEVLDKVFETLHEFESYPEWVDAWNEFHDGIEMAPHPHKYYVFENLLTRDQLDFDDETSTPAADTLEDPSLGERWRYNLAKSMGLDHHNGPIASILSRLICKVQPGNEWHLDKTALICAAECPKGLEDGPCGESREDGLCEFGHKPCFYHSVIRLEQWRKNLQVFEEPYGDK